MNLGDIILLLFILYTPLIVDSNLYLQTLQICDLGSARPLEHTTCQTTVVGTYPWMAPEVCPLGVAHVINTFPAMCFTWCTFCCVTFVIVKFLI